VDLLLIPDHYIFRMLYSQGIQLEALGVPRLDGGPVEAGSPQGLAGVRRAFLPVSRTPTGMWLVHEFEDVFGVGRSSTRTVRKLFMIRFAACLATPEMKPRQMFERFKIEVLCTTDAATILSTLTGQSVSRDGRESSGPRSGPMPSSTWMQKAGGPRSDV